MKKNLVFCFLIIISITIHAEPLPELAGKRITVSYEKGKSPDELFQRVLDYSKELIASGDLVSSEMATEAKRSGLLKIVVPTDSLLDAFHEREKVLRLIQDKTLNDNIPLSGRFLSFSENKFFGDKRIGYIDNSYIGCYFDEGLINGLTKVGAIVVNENENPDIKITVGIDACMTEDELNVYISRNSTLYPFDVINTSKQLVNETVSKQHPVKNGKIGNDLVQSGSNMQLGTSSSGNAGLAMAAIGVVANLLGDVSDSNNGTNKEHDFIRYHIKLEGKNKQTYSYYQHLFTNDFHEHGKTLNPGAFVNPIQLMFITFRNWVNDDKKLRDELKPYQLEPNLIKSLSSMVKENKK